MLHGVSVASERRFQKRRSQAKVLRACIAASHVQLRLAYHVGKG